MFCNHAEETVVIGEPEVPCPLCGLGTSQEDLYPSAEEFQDGDDSQDALRHALSLNEETTHAAVTGQGDLVNLRHYW